MNPIESHFSEIVAETKTLSRSLEEMRLERACKFARSGKQAEAESELKDFSFSENRLQIAAYLLLAKVYAQQDFKDKAALYWNHILKNDPENREAISGLSALNQSASGHHILRVIQTGILFIFLGLITFIGFSVIQSRFEALENRLHAVSQEIANSNKNQFESLNAVENNLRDELASFEQLVGKSFTRVAESNVRTTELIEEYQVAIHSEQVITQSKIEDISKREMAQSRAIQTSIVGLRTAFQKKLEQLLNEQTAANTTIKDDLDQLTQLIQTLKIKVESTRAEVLNSKKVIMAVQAQIESVQNPEKEEPP